MYPYVDPKIAISQILVEAIDSHIRLFGTFQSRRELVAHAVAAYLERAEEEIGLAS